MWTTSYIVSQILTVVIYILFCLSYIERSRKQILITNIGSHILQGIAFYLLGGFAGLGMNVFYMFRDVFLLIDIKHHNDKKITKRDYIILLVFLAMIVILAIISYESILGLFSVFATVASTIAIWQKNTQVYRFLGTVCSIFWLGYHIYLGSIFGIVLESILLVVTLIGFIRECLRNKKEPSKSEFY